MRVLESNIESYGVGYARKLGYITLKMTPQGQKGWPDRVFINPQGVHIYVEFKRPDETVRRLQEYRCQQLRERNVIVHYNIDARYLIKEILDEHIHDTPS